jgi:hypothetical protein
MPLSRLISAVLMFGSVMLAEQLKTRYFAMCIILLTLAFVASLSPRSNYLGLMREGMFEDQTARTMKFARNWYRDGIVSDYGLQIENPASVEFTSLFERVPYISFLPGTVVPVYLLALAQGREPDIIDVQRVNLMTQYLVALLSCITVWLLSTRISLRLRACAALLSGVSYIAMPFLFYEHQQVYYSDAALMLPYVAFLCAMAYFGRFPSRRAPIVYTAILAWFICVDWFGVLVGGVWGIMQLIHYRGSRRQAIMSLMPLLCAGTACGVFFFFQLHVTGLLDMLIGVAKYRMYVSSVNGLSIDAMSIYIAGYMLASYGEIGCFLIFLVAAYTLLCLAKLAISGAGCMHAVDALRVQVIALMVLASLICIWVIPIHFYEHDFSPIRLSLLLTIAGGALLPQMLASVMPLRQCTIIWLVIAALLMGFVNLSVMIARQGMGWFHTAHYTDYVAFRYVYDHAAYGDIVFSPSVHTEFKYPTQELVMAMKRIYILPNITDLNDYKINDFEAETMKHYGLANNMQARRLPEHAPKYLLVMKKGSCWPLTRPAQSFLKRYAKLLHDEETFAYYALKKMDYRRFDITLCPVKK